MKLRLLLASGVLVFSFASAAIAQTAQPLPDINAMLMNVADQPPTHTGFVLDRSMVQAAGTLLASGDAAEKRVAASISSIAIDNYRYGQPAVYTPSAMASIVAAYRTAGWKHLVTAHDLAGTANTQHRHPPTDLWLHFSGSEIDGITVLSRGSRDMAVIQVACNLRPLDLMRLGGHFGIPKVDPSAVMVPDPNDR